MTSRRWSSYLTECVLGCLKKHPGLAVVFGGPGARLANVCLTYYWRVEECFVPCRSEALDCVPARAVNALSCFKGGISAKKAEEVFKTSGVKFKKLGEAGRIIQGLGMKIAIQRVASDCKYIKWLSDLKEGVWLVRFIVPNRYEHCITINGEKQCILDSEELYPIALNEETVVMCAGGDREKIIVAEVSRLVESTCCKML